MCIGQCVYTIMHKGCICGRCEEGELDLANTIRTKHHTVCSASVQYTTHYGLGQNTQSVYAPLWYIFNAKKIV